MRTGMSFSSRARDFTSVSDTSLFSTTRWLYFKLLALCSVNKNERQNGKQDIIIHLLKFILFMSTHE